MNEAVMNAELVQADQLSRAERLRLTWALAWPCALLGLVYTVLLEQLQLSEAQRQNISLLGGIPQLLLFAPWIVRRTVGLDFIGFHLLVIRAGAPEGTRTMSYRESLSVAWLITWRSSMILLLFLVPAITVLVVLGRPPKDLYGLSGWLLSTVSELLIFYAWIVTAAVGKGYSRFSLRLDRS